jgi:hypothetical protein
MRYFWEFARDPNPQYRYAAARSLQNYLSAFPASFSKPDKSTDRPLGEDIEGLFREERSPLVRRAFATMLGQFLGPPPPPGPDPILKLPETIYWLEASYLAGGSYSNFGPPGPPTPLVLLTRAMMGEFPNGILSLYFAPDVAMKLTEGFLKNINDTDLAFLENVSDLALRDAVRALSPLDKGGLGTFDRLQNIDQIDALYLFLQQVRFYKNWGDLLITSGD